MIHSVIREFTHLPSPFLPGVWVAREFRECGQCVWRVRADSGGGVAYLPGWRSLACTTPSAIPRMAT
jgi:hypothetical protein